MDDTHNITKSLTMGHYQCLNAGSIIDEPSAMPGCLHLILLILGGSGRHFKGLHVRVWALSIWKKWIGGVILSKCSKKCN